MQKKLKYLQLFLIPLIALTVFFENMLFWDLWAWHIFGFFWKSKPCPMGTWVNSFGEFSPDPFTISCHEYFACENGSKAAVGEELDILGLLSETGLKKVGKKIEGWGRPIVETFGTSRGSIFKLSRGSQLPYNEK